MNTSHYFVKDTDGLEEVNHGFNFLNRFDMESFMMSSTIASSIDYDIQLTHYVI